jgi:hypothetical protein
MSPSTSLPTFVRSALPTLGVVLVMGLASVAAPKVASAQSWKSAFDPKSFVSPPLGAKADGFGGELRVDADFFARAAALRSSQPIHRATEDIVRVGEVLVVPGDPDTVTAMGNRFGIEPTALKNITRKAIAFAGDNFEIITLWVTFDDRGTDALAYAVNVRNEVSGLGRRLSNLDLSGSYGSQGKLRTVVNMKSIGLSSTDERNNWKVGLAVWGQETGHRFMAFMDIRDPRTGRPSDRLLGRDCSHFDWFVDTQGSVQDGLAWTDNRNGTFTWTDSSVRFGNLDLYGMGLIAADEVPPFFAIEDVPNYKRPACADWRAGGIPTTRTVSGTRLDLSIEDVVAANGPRIPAESSGYVRELQVVVTRPNESVNSTIAQGLAQRIDKARLWWEEWARTASNNRMLICTSSTADCGDARSDVKAILPVESSIPVLGPVPVTVQLANPGMRVATGVKAWVEARVGDRKFLSGPPKVVAELAAGTERTEVFNVDVGPLPCGTELEITARTQSDFHYSRQRVSLPVGVKTFWTEGFETDSGWIVNPEGTDTGQGATWERGQPQLSFLADRVVQPDSAFEGTNAFVTGIVPVDSGLSGGFVKRGRVTLQSPIISTAGLGAVTLRYALSFSGMRAAGNGGVETSPQSFVSVEARSVGGGDDAASVGAWLEIDRLSDAFAAPWAARLARLPAELDTSHGVQFRFIAADENADGLGGVEVGIDNLSLTSTLTTCAQNNADAGADGGADLGNDEGGCGCRLGRRANVNKASLGILACLLIGLFLGRRRR